MADGLRRIALGLYERAGKEEKEEAMKYFKKLRGNGEIKVRVRGFKAGVESGLANEKVFNELDSNKDGVLDLEDVLVLFYYTVKKAITILRCRGCSQLIFGPSFSCFKCLFNTADRRFALCRDCYGKGKFSHEHPLTSTAEAAAAGDMLHDQTLLLKFSDLIIANGSGYLAEKDMKKLWEDAKSQIGAASPEVEEMANNYFKSMGNNYRLDLNKFAELTIVQEEFLKLRPDSDFATNFMKNKMREKYTQSYLPSTTPTSAIVRHNYAASPSPLDTHYYSVNSSNGNDSISPLKVVTTIFKILDMALTIASLSSMCTIM